MMFLAQSSTFWTGLGFAAAQWLIPIAIGIASIFALSYLSKQGKDKIRYAKQSLSLVRAFLGNRLGDKAGAVIDAWLSGIKHIEDGDFTREDAVKQFVDFVIIATKNNGVTLSQDDIDIITEAIISTLEHLDVKDKPTQQAVSIMMAEKL